MKVQHLILALTVLAVVATSCEEKQVMPGDNDHNQASLVIPDPTPDPEGFKVPEGTINVYKAVEIAKSLKFGEVSKDRYLIKGYVISFNHNESFKTDFPVYGNEMFYISAVAPTEEIQPLNNFYAYRALGRYGAKLPDLDCIKEGDFVVISCYITNYNGVFESSGACFVSASNNEHFNATFPEVTAPTTKGDDVEFISTSPSRNLYLSSHFDNVLESKKRACSSEISPLYRLHFWAKTGYFRSSEYLGDLPRERKEQSAPRLTQLQR